MQFHNVKKYLAALDDPCKSFLPVYITGQTHYITRQTKNLKTILNRYLYFFPTVTTKGHPNLWPGGKGVVFTDHDRVIWVQSVPWSVATLLCPWIRRFTMIISALWLRKSTKFRWKEAKRQPKNLENSEILCGFVERMAPPSLSREIRITMIK